MDWKAESANCFPESQVNTTMKHNNLLGSKQEFLKPNNTNTTCGRKSIKATSKQFHMSFF